MSRFKRKLKQKYWQWMLFLGLVETEPPILIDKNEIDLSSLVHIQSIINELLDSYDAAEEDGDFCGCFLNGFGDAVSIVQWLADEQIAMNQAAINIHDELDAFSRGELEL